MGFGADAFSYSLHALALPPQPRPILVASRHSTLGCISKIGRCTTATYLSIVQMNGAVKQVFPARTSNSYRASRFIPNLQLLKWRSCQIPSVRAYRRPSHVLALSRGRMKWPLGFAPRSSPNLRFLPQGPRGLIGTCGRPSSNSRGGINQTASLALGAFPSAGTCPGINAHRGLEGKKKRGRG